MSAGLEYGTVQKKTIIGSGQSQSGQIQSQQSTLVAILMPLAWDAASVTIEVCMDGTNFYPLYDKTGAEYVVTVAAGRFVFLDPVALLGAKQIKLRSGTAALPVTQTANREIVAVFRPLY